MDIKQTLDRWQQEMVEDFENGNVRQALEKLLEHEKVVITEGCQVILMTDGELAHDIELCYDPIPEKTYTDIDYEKCQIPLSFDKLKSFVAMGFISLPKDSTVEDVFKNIIDHEINKIDE